MPQTVLLIFEMIGTVAFALSGAMTAIRKKMDIFGVIILGIITAVGGGVIRDIVLGNTPPLTFKNPIYAVIAIITSVITFLPFVRKAAFKAQHIFDTMLLYIDSLGLAVFTVVGIQTAILFTDDFNFWLLLFVGVITGTGGGVLRDVLAGDTPHIFVKHFYATASLIGAMICIILWKPIGSLFAMLAGAVVIMSLRICAAKFKWNLPKPEL